MQIVYDNIVFDLQDFGGISVVWQELLSRIALDFDVGYVDVDAEKNANCFRKKLAITPNRVLATIRHAHMSRYLPVRLDADVPFVFHSSYYRYCNNPQAVNVTTVHDFTYERFSSGLRQKVHTWQKFAAIRHSAVVVCISENTKRDLLRLMPDVDERRVSVIYNGVSEAYCRLLEPVAAAQLPFPQGTYVVFIGRRDKYKNFDLTVRSVAATSLNLLIVGSMLSKAEQAEVEKYLPPRRYQTMSHVSDERLNQLYNHAAALVYPSSYEGFGLPVLEAQRAGCPVIALNASSIPEVIGDTPLLMPQLSEQALVERLNLLGDGELMKQVRARGYDNCRRFSWDKMAQDYIQVYHNLMKTR